jgi:hypothetical protein
MRRPVRCAICQFEYVAATGRQKPAPHRRPPRWHPSSGRRVSLRAQPRRGHRSGSPLARPSPGPVAATPGPTGEAAAGRDIRRRPRPTLPAFERVPAPRSAPPQPSLKPDRPAGLQPYHGRSLHRARPSDHHAARVGARRRAPSESAAASSSAYTACRAAGVAGASERLSASTPPPGRRAGRSDLASIFHAPSQQQHSRS